MRRATGAGLGHGFGVSDPASARQTCIRVFFVHDLASTERAELRLGASLQTFAWSSILRPNCRILHSKFGRRADDIGCRWLRDGARPRCMKVTEHPAAESSDPTRDAAIASLLDACFDGVHGGRTWFKQIPHQRLLAWSGSDLMGHVGMEYRVVRVGEAFLPVVGIVDLCVAPAARRQGIGAALLLGVEERARGQLFALAMADDPRAVPTKRIQIAPRRERDVSGHRRVALPQRDPPQARRSLHGQAVGSRRVARWTDRPFGPPFLMLDNRFRLSTEPAVRLRNARDQGKTCVTVRRFQ